jgi:hypothetical protein
MLDSGTAGQSKGGLARAESLDPAERSLIALKGAAARWERDSETGALLPKAIYGSPSNPLRIADLEIPCYVLDDGRRVLIQSGMIKSLAMAQGTASGKAGDRLVRFASTKGVQPFIPNDLADVIKNPIKFRSPSGAAAYGYEATILVHLCDAVLAARKAGRLHYQQVHIAERCEILVRALAQTGIIALVDEVTGYQEFRPRDELAALVRKYVAVELQKWVSTFPVDFYREMYRLNGWDYSNMKPNSPKPLTVGRLTDDVVYKRLPAGVRAELRRLTERDEHGWLKTKLHQRLSGDLGHPRLREHLSAVIALMKASDNWAEFKTALNRALPKPDKNYELALRG